MERVTAFVLAGGKSTRMGTDKAFLEFQGRTLLANALDLGRAIAGDVRIVGDRAKFRAFGATIEDVYPGRGPLAGIHAALNSSETELNLVIGVDLPLLEARFLEFLLLAAEQSGAVVTVPQVGGYYEPLCAVYRQSFAVAADQALSAGKNKIDALFDSVAVRVVSHSEIAQQGFSSTMFRNVNTPEDWKLAQEDFERREHV